jgi:hypothetical protein
MPEDDDTNYTVAGFVLMKRKGRDFCSDDVADLWLGDIPLLHTCTAERVAYRNLSNLVPPPASALLRNPYREWIGAQIRADFFGYAAAGNPKLAAEYAFRDAAISHVKNGIYGEMFVAAMIAAAALEGAGAAGAGAAGAKSGGAQETEAALRRIIDAGLGEIPAACRLAEDVKKAIAWRGQGLGYDQAIGRIHAQWDENIGHHWTHTNSNAQIVVLGLLWAEGDFEKAICRAVEACFDTDCNGATVGSIMGMLLGAQALPQKWIAPLNDTLDTGIAGYNRVSISALAKESCELFGRDISPRA